MIHYNFPCVKDTRNLSYRFNRLRFRAKRKKKKRKNSACEQTAPSDNWTNSILKQTIDKETTFSFDEAREEGEGGGHEWFFSENSFSRASPVGSRRLKRSWKTRTNKVEITEPKQDVRLCLNDAVIVAGIDRQRRCVNGIRVSPDAADGCADNGRSYITEGK